MSQDQRANDIKKLQEEIGRLAKERDQEKEDAELNKKRDWFVRVSSTLFDKSSAYTNLIILGGYLGFFNIWNIMKPEMATWEMTGAALSIAISLAFFIFWEIYVMIYTAYCQKKMGELSSILNVPIGKFDEKLLEFEKKEAEFRSHVQKVWPYILAITIISALVSIFIMFYSFFRVLPPVF